MVKAKKKSGNSAKKEQRYENQLKWIFVWMGVLVLIILAILLIGKSLQKFEYGGLEFEKIKFGELELFYSKIPIKTAEGVLVANYNLYLRNDPRKLRYIPINGTVRLTLDSIVSIDESIEGCSDNGIAGVTLGTFFKAAGINMISASTNETVAEERNITHATCEDADKISVIILQQTDENSIIEESKDCYSINFKDCEIIPSVERFILAAAAHSKGIGI